MSVGYEASASGNGPLLSQPMIAQKQAIAAHYPVVLLGCMAVETNWHP
jgi:hypothetical protein